MITYNYNLPEIEATDLLESMAQEASFTLRLPEDL